MKFILGVLATSLLLYLCDGFKVLVVFPVLYRSHGILGQGFVHHLLKTGYEVTYITPYPLKINNENLTQVDLGSIGSSLENLFNVSAILNKEFVLDRKHTFEIAKNLTNKGLEHENVQNFLKDTKQNFDLVIADWVFSEIYTGFAAVYNCPIIWFCSTEPHSTIISIIDDIPNPVYTTNKELPLGFLDRLTLLRDNVLILFFKNTQFKSEEQGYQKYFGPAMALRGKTLPPYAEKKYDVSFLMANTHISMGTPISLPFSYVPIGGFHIEEPVKPLPENLQKIMDQSKNGVIYFSLGSTVKSKDFPDQLKQGLVKVLGKLKQSVIWKFEEVLPDLPKNIHILQWVPQTSVLAHPNCVLFISHGGLLSTTEAVHFGVPMIGIPLFGDQFANIDRAVAKGFAKKVELSYTLVEDLEGALDILEDPTYSEKAKELSFIYHHRPASPGKELVHWVEHAIRTNGAKHLRSNALLTPWYQKLYLDLILLVFNAVVIQIAVLVVVTKKILRYYRKNVKDSKVKKS